MRISSRERHKMEANGLEHERRENLLFLSKCYIVLKSVANIRNYLYHVCALSDTDQVIGLLVG